MTKNEKWSSVKNMSNAYSKSKIMADQDDVELLFFDTFSHEINEDLNLDLVQFPKPVYVTEVRIIPLGARVQADFPGGVRLGATNPSTFGIEFFVNDLGKPGASTFESLGSFEYNQNDCIHLECENDKIPTDGLVLRGWYTTITLAVYGIFTKNLTEQIASPQPPPPPVEPIPVEAEIAPVQVPQDEGLLKEDWSDEVIQQPSNPEVTVFEPEPFQEAAFEENFEQTQYADEIFYQASVPDSSREHEKRVSKRKSRSTERSASRNRTYSRSDSNDREYTPRQKREWSRSPEYRHSRRLRRDRSRDMSDHGEREHKRPRTPPTQVIESPRRPRSPEQITDPFSDAEDTDYKYRTKTSKTSVQPIRVISEASIVETASPIGTPEDIQEPQTVDDDTMSQDEQFEPILSDEEIGDDNDDPENEEIELDDDYEEPIKSFDPYKMPLNRFETDLSSVCCREKDILLKIYHKFDIQTRIESRESFCMSTSDEKENFVYISEQLLAQLQQISMHTLRKRDEILEKVFKDQRDCLKMASTVLKIALDFDCACAQPQPGYKIRHIKIGARMMELLAASTYFLMFFVNEERCDPFKNLFELYDKDNMALSIKIMILKSVYAILDSREGIDIFLNNKLNGYQRLLSLIQRNPLTRAKFALKSILRKINLYEALENIQDVATKQFVLVNHYVENPFQTLEFCIQEVRKAILTDAVGYQQPKRFLPVSEKFEIVKDLAAEKSWEHMLQSYFKAHAFGESLLLIISNQDIIPLTLLHSVLDIIQTLVRSPIGLNYLIDDCFETTQLLTKCLLNISEDYLRNYTDAEKRQNEEDQNLDEKSTKNNSFANASSSQKLGLEMAFKIQTRYHLDAIVHTKDDDIIIDHLHALYTQISDFVSRSYTVETIGMNNNILPFLSLVEKERKAQMHNLQTSTDYKMKSPIISYCVELIDCCVRYCSNIEYLFEHGSSILSLVKSHESFEPSVSAILQEMSVYLKPLEATNFRFDDITQLCETIKRSIEFVTTFPGDLIMGLRILRHLCVENIDMNESSTKELKYRYLMLQFYSADGIMTLTNILEKLNTYFEQPGLHSATLMTSQAVHACLVILPSLKILREMLTCVIQCRGKEFKDLTAIEHLLRTYCLMYYYPRMSQAYDEAQKVKSEVIKILLAYTQPNPEDQESVHKSLWTQMVKELIKFILTTPSTFIPGLQAFAELLPLPLPVQTSLPLTESESQLLITERKLWSAHLHPQSTALSELIQTIAPSSFPQLIDLLTRVCLQLADLAPNMTLLVSKSVIDLILLESSSNPNGSALLARLLIFLGQLTAYASVKTSSLSIFSGKLYDFFNQILTNNEKSEALLQCQENVHRILQNFFDSEVSMIATNSGGKPELNLACALPPKELIPEIVNSILTNLFNSNLESSVTAVACRTLIILTEHDVTFYYLRSSLYSKKEQFHEWINKVVDAHESGTFREILGTCCIFLRALLIIDDSSADSMIPTRTLKLSSKELAEIVGWQSGKIHSFQKIRDFIKTDEECAKEIDLQQELNNLVQNFQNIDDLMETDEKPDIVEPNLPQAEGIVTQYLSRPIYSIYESNDDTQLTSNYWLEPIQIGNVGHQQTVDYERIACDLSEMVKTCLSPETNLSSDCKRILHLSASPQSNRERTTTAPCFRTRRVEVEPTTGRPEKKIFVTPMRGRGFARAPPSRGDLFRSRPPNTSRPPSLHVDDFLALETCGAQPTGPTGYNKLSRDIISIRGTRGGRGRSGRIGTISSGGNYRKMTIRTGSPSTWGHGVDSSVSSTGQHFRTATSEPVVSTQFGGDPHYVQPHFGGPPIRSRGRGRVRTFMR